MLILLVQTGDVRMGQHASTSLVATSVCVQTHSSGCTVRYEQTTAPVLTVLAYVVMVSVSIRAGMDEAMSASVMRLAVVII